MKNISKILIHSKDKIISLSFEDFPDEINVDEITRIDYSNLYGEAITISTLLNKIGILKSEVETVVEELKLDLEIYEAEKTRFIREKAVKDEQKITEKSLESELRLDKGWQLKSRELISSKKDLKNMESLYWALNSKDKKLSVMMKGVTPDELANEIIEGVINTIFIKKHDKKLT
jgi:hypothetical protein